MGSGKTALKETPKDKILKHEVGYLQQLHIELDQLRTENEELKGEMLILNEDLFQMTKKYSGSGVRWKKYKRNLIRGIKVIGQQFVIWTQSHPKP